MNKLLHICILLFLTCRTSEAIEPFVELSSPPKPNPTARIVSPPAIEAGKQRDQPIEPSFVKSDLEKRKPFGSDEVKPQNNMARELSSTENFKALRAVALERGRVDVITGLRVAYAPEGKLSKLSATQQRSDIKANQNRILQLLDNSTGNQRRERTITHSTIQFMAISVTTDELDALSKDPDVISSPQQVDLP
jgi:hypothetical protein